MGITSTEENGRGGGRKRKFCCALGTAHLYFSSTPYIWEIERGESEQQCFSQITAKTVLENRCAFEEEEENKFSVSLFLGKLCIKKGKSEQCFFQKKLPMGGHQNYVGKAYCAFMPLE